MRIDSNEKTPGRSEEVELVPQLLLPDKLKHLRTEVEGSWKKRVYDKPQTTFERLKACESVDPKQIERLESLKSKLNPFRLKESVEKKLHRILRLAKSEASRLAA